MEGARKDGKRLRSLQATLASKTNNIVTAYESPATELEKYFMRSAFKLISVSGEFVLTVFDLTEVSTV